MVWLSPSQRKAWIEVWYAFSTSCKPSRRLPNGRRGLKFGPAIMPLMLFLVAFPTEGVDWSFKQLNHYCSVLGRLPNGRRGLKYGRSDAVYRISVSPSQRKAWIEVSLFVIAFWSHNSRLPNGRRGLKFHMGLMSVNPLSVAFPTEGVDWSSSAIALLCILNTSPSQRKAWIEV